MALSYPEGECFFMGEALHNTYYDAKNEHKFVSYMMIEYIDNVEADHANDECNYRDGYSHSRSGYHIVNAQQWNTNYGCWDKLPVQYGPDATTIKRRVDKTLLINPNDFRDHEKGLSARARFMFVPMPTIAERYVYIDILTHIRAIYLPVSQSASSDYPGLNYWVAINFALERTVDIWRGKEFLPHNFHSTYGTRVARDQTLVLDVPRLIELVCMPRQLRDGNPYALKLISMVGYKTVASIATSATYGRDDTIDWTDMVKANFGLDVQWLPCEEGTWFTNLLRTMLEIGIGFIPIVGTVWGCATSIADYAMSYPDEFWRIVGILSPGFKVTQAMKDALNKSAAETRALMPQEWADGRPDVPGQPSRSAQAPVHFAPPIRKPGQHKRPKLTLKEIGASAMFIAAGKTLAATGKPHMGPPTEQAKIIEATYNPPTGDAKV